MLRLFGNMHYPQKNFEKNVHLVHCGVYIDQILPKKCFF